MSMRFKTPEEKTKYLESISFQNLVKAIDEKWGHTYKDYDPNAFPDFDELYMTYTHD